MDAPDPDSGVAERARQGCPCLAPTGANVDITQIGERGVVERAVVRVPRLLVAALVADLILNAALVWLLVALVAN